MPNERTRFADRLNDALDNIHFPKLGAGRQARLAEMLDIPAAEVGPWLKGEAFPKTSVLVKLSDLTQTRSNWLLSGHGDPYPKDNNPRGAGKNPPPTGKDKLSKEAFDLGLAWMKLPKQQREAIARVVQELQPTKK
jgi:transcriptional regulator with XRE-family HTH domain